MTKINIFLIMVIIIVVAVWYHRKVDIELSDTGIPPSPYVSQDYLNGYVAPAIDKAGIRMEIHDTEISYVKDCPHPKFQACYYITSLPWYKLLFQ